MERECMTEAVVLTETSSSHNSNRTSVKVARRMRTPYFLKNNEELGALIEQQACQEAL
jgi:hypothetical protein